MKKLLIIITMSMLTCCGMCFLQASVDFGRFAKWEDFFPTIYHFIASFVITAFFGSVLAIVLWVAAGVSNFTRNRDIQEAYGSDALYCATHALYYSGQCPHCNRDSENINKDNG